MVDLLTKDVLSENSGITHQHSPNSSPHQDLDGTDGGNEDSIAAALNAGASFQLNASETITSDYVFINTKASEFNYSENPSFISGSTGEVIYDEFINNPATFITTAGLYNDANELLAVAKLSRPLPNNFTKALLIRAKLDF